MYVYRVHAIRIIKNSCETHKIEKPCLVINNVNYA